MEGDSISVYIIHRIVYFNPLPPHGGRPAYESTEISARDISIHSLRMEGDLCFSMFFAGFYISIHSLRMEGDRITDSPEGVLIISIHSLRMEGDYTNAGTSTRQCDFNPLPPHGGRLGDPGGLELPRNHFNPLPPHGGRPLDSVEYRQAFIFQSTPSAWRETNGVMGLCGEAGISIHSLRMEGDDSN